MVPEVRDAARACKDAPHAATGCIMPAGPRGEIEYDLADVCRPYRERIKEHPPVIQFVMDSGGQPDAVA
jgi:hypothetical protein